MTSIGAAILALSTFAPLPLGASLAPPLSRDYEGAREVRLARLGPPSDPPADPPAPAAPAPADPSATEPAEPPADEPADEPPAATEPETGAEKPETAPEDMSIDDVFGTAEEHKDVVKQPADGKAAVGASAQPPVKSRREKIRDALDMRVRILSSAYYDVHKTEKRGFGRNENRLEFYFAYTPNRHLQIVGDIEPVFFGLPQAQELDDLATMQMLTPFHLESDAAYIALIDVLPNLDIKIGRQTLVWGTADKFNPTNNISPDDLEDRPLFTEPIANQMVVVDFAPLQDKLWFQGVYVPMFYPALLPPSASAALKDPESPVPYTRPSDLAKIDRLQAQLDINDTLIPTVVGHVHMPSRRFTSGQSAIKLGTSLGPVDMSFSYYNGRHDIPTPVRVLSSQKEPDEGTGAECCFKSDVTLIYPRMQVAGFDFATQLPFLGNMGLWGEGALFFPQAQELYIEFPIGIDVDEDGDLDRSMKGPTIRKTPYIKATAGLDYTFGKHVYVQAQYLRGFIDEFGADHIGNYLVAGGDLIFFGRHLIFRVFGVVDFPTGKGDHASYVVYPELMIVPPWGSVTFDIGSFVLLGREDTKFGQKATGSSIVFFKVIGTF